MNKLTVIIFLVLAAGVVGYFVMKQGSEPQQSYQPTSATGSSGADNTMDSVKEFAVEGGMYYFTPKEITVNKGDTVKIVFTNKEGMHDFVIDEFNARTKIIQTGQTDTITFVADKAGTFEYYCSVGDHRAKGMKGMLIVAE
jgi:nitrosocyanin